MHLQIISKNIAKSLNMKRYFTGLACLNGGIAERFVSSCSCQCAFCVSPEKRNAKAKLVYQKSKNNTLTPDYQKSKNSPLTPEKLEKKRETTRIWKQNNPEKVRQNKREYHKNNPHVSRAKRALRRATLRNRTPLWFGEFDKFVMVEAAHLCELRKISTGIDWQVDHMFPLQGKEVSGLHCGINIQVIPSFLNTSKSNKMIYTECFDWISSIMPS